MAVTYLDELAGGPFGTLLADPPWRFQNKTGKVAPEHERLSRYDTMDGQDIAKLPVGDVMAAQSHCWRRSSRSERTDERFRRSLQRHCKKVGRRSDKCALGNDRVPDRRRECCNECEPERAAGPDTRRRSSDWRYFSRTDTLGARPKSIAHGKRRYAFLITHWPTDSP